MSSKGLQELFSLWKSLCSHLHYLLWWKLFLISTLFFFSYYQLKSGVQIPITSKKICIVALSPSHSGGNLRQTACNIIMFLVYELPIWNCLILCNLFSHYSPSVFSFSFLIFRIYWKLICVLLIPYFIHWKNYSMLSFWM